MKTAFGCLAVSDFNMGNFAGYLANDTSFPKVEVTTVPYGQVWQVLIDREHPVWREKYDFAVIWTLPESVVPSFYRLLEYQSISLEALLEEVDMYADSLARVVKNFNFAFVPSWVLPPHLSGMLDWHVPNGIAYSLARMNTRLAEKLQGYTNVYLLDAQRMVNAVGTRAFNPKLWYMAKIPFGNEVFISAVESIKSALRGLTGKTKKLVIVDLDDTLWGGIVGDVGWENLQLGGHDPIGEALVDFQMALKTLRNRGIVLGIVSKNDETIAIDAINRHPEMKLRLADFAHWKINWNDKAQNIAELVHELHLSLDAVVFIDDNPIERARVREALPDILVLELPQEKMLYKAALLSLTCFDSPTLSMEDVARTEMYAAERKRREAQENISTLDSWLETLNTEVIVSPLTVENAARAVQLLNKTNQMNLSTRRLTEAELWQWLDEPQRMLWTFHVADRFGESGLTGIASGEVHGATFRIVDYILSCRVMGRKVEETLLAVMVTHAREIGCDTVRAEYQSTEKNKPCLEFFQRSGFDHNVTDDVFSWLTRDDYPIPSQIHCEIKQTVEVHIQ